MNDALLNLLFEAVFFGIPTIAIAFFGAWMFVIDFKKGK